MDGAKQEGKLSPCAQAPQEILAEVHNPLPGDPRLPEIPPQKHFQQPAQEQRFTAACESLMSSTERDGKGVRNQERGKKTLSLQLHHLPLQGQHKASSHSCLPLPIQVHRSTSWLPRLCGWCSRQSVLYQKDLTIETGPGHFTENPPL